MGDIVKTVDRAEYEKRKNEHLQVRQCPICGDKIKLVMSFPVYEPETVMFQCDTCGHSLKGYIPVELYSCEESFGTFKTADCIGRAVLTLVDAWNSHAKTEYYLHEEKRQAYYRQKYGEAKSCITIDLETTEKTEVTSNA